MELFLDGYLFLFVLKKSVDVTILGRFEVEDVTREQSFFVSITEKDSALLATHK